MLVASVQTRRGVPLWPPILATRGQGSRSWRHAHHAIHLVLAIGGELKVRWQSEWKSAAGVVTAPDTEHEIDVKPSELKARSGA